MHRIGKISEVAARDRGRTVSSERVHIHPRVSPGEMSPTGSRGTTKVNHDFGLMGFDHVDLRVKNRQKARRFFVEQLGMDVVGEGEDHTFLLFGDQVLGLHDGKDTESLRGVDHIALRVEEWTGLRNRIRRARVTVTGEKERLDSRSLYLKGPEGIRIELVWRPDPHIHAGHPERPAGEGPAGPGRGGSD